MTKLKHQNMGTNIIEEEKHFLRLSELKQFNEEYYNNAINNIPIIHLEFLIKKDFPLPCCFVFSKSVEGEDYWRKVLEDGLEFKKNRVLQIYGRAKRVNVEFVDDIGDLKPNQKQAIENIKKMIENKGPIIIQVDSGIGKGIVTPIIVGSTNEVYHVNPDIDLHITHPREFEAYKELLRSGVMQYDFKQFIDQIYKIGSSVSVLNESTIKYLNNVKDFTEKIKSIKPEFDKPKSKYHK